LLIAAGTGCGGQRSEGEVTLFLETVIDGEKYRGGVTRTTVPWAQW